ncbi:MAG: flagellar export protein FliJ [Desulfobaccales bacterium]
MKPGGRFRFPLEVVLKVRKLREEQARLALARAQNQLARSRQALSTTKNLITETLERIQTPVFLMAFEYQLVLGYLEHLKQAKDGWLAQIAREETEVAEKMQAVEKAHQERLLLENLREKKRKEFRRELIKFLENQDEALVVTRWRRS